MDTSEQYIKMCDCEEIQGRHTFSEGDWFRYHSGYCVEAIRAYFGGDIEDELCNAQADTSCRCSSGHRQYLWLPRQDQLQEMVDEWWKENGDYGQPLIKGLYDFAMAYNPQPFREDELPIKSWEQLWLAFVMKSLHSKVWDGNSWVASC